MSEKVKFYYNPMSRGRIVHWMLEETGAEYEIQKMEWKTADHKSPEYLKINPMGKIPAITHRGVAITETAAICAYLADAFPKAGLAPALDAPERGSYYRWLFFSSNCVEPATMDRAYPRAKAPESSHLGYGSYDLVMNVMEEGVKKGFVCNNRFSAADLYLASQIGWGIFMKNIDPRPAFTEYLMRCEDRPAYRRYIDQAGPIS